MTDFLHHCWYHFHSLPYQGKNHAEELDQHEKAIAAERAIQNSILEKRNKYSSRNTYPEESDENIPGSRELILNESNYQITGKSFSLHSSLHVWFNDSPFPRQAL